VVAEVPVRAGSASPTGPPSPPPAPLRTRLL
jgi:hypothetical protein